MRRDVPDLHLTAPGERTREEDGGGWMKEEGDKLMGKERRERRGEFQLVADNTKSTMKK